jgi:adenylate cyclase
MGILTGPAVMGPLGSDQSLKYTTLGDSINVAARLEAFDKPGFSADSEDHSWRILIGEETRRQIGAAFEVEDLGAHALKGKREKTQIYRVLGPAGEPEIPVEDSI